MDLSDEYDQLLRRTAATVEKFKEGAEELKDKLGKARANRRVQLLAMINRMENKYEGATSRLEHLADATDEAGTRPSRELGALHQQVVSELSNMKRTIENRIR